MINKIIPSHRHIIKKPKGFFIAIYHLSIKIVSRGKGKSAVAAAAYRAGEKITNQYDGIEHDYTRKGGIVHTEIILPENAPAEYGDRAVLWNAVEKIEKAKNSQLAREIENALGVRVAIVFVVYANVGAHSRRYKTQIDIFTDKIYALLSR